MAGAFSDEHRYGFRNGHDNDKKSIMLSNLEYCNRTVESYEGALGPQVRVRAPAAVHISCDSAIEPLTRQ
jgi:hypothetical protein